MIFFTSLIRPVQIRAAFKTTEPVRLRDYKHILAQRAIKLLMLRVCYDLVYPDDPNALVSSEQMVFVHPLSCRRGLFHQPRTHLL